MSTSSTITVKHQSTRQKLRCSDDPSSETNYNDCNCHPIPSWGVQCLPTEIKWCGGKPSESSGETYEAVCAISSGRRTNPGASSDSSGFLVCAPADTLDNPAASCPPLGVTEDVSVSRIDAFKHQDPPKVCTDGDVQDPALKPLVDCTYDLAGLSDEEAKNVWGALSFIDHCETPPCFFDFPSVSSDDLQYARNTLLRLCGGDGQTPCDTMGGTRFACDPSRGGAVQIDGMCRNQDGNAKYGEACGSTWYGGKTYVRECDDPWRCEGGRCTGVEPCAQDLHSFGCASDQGRPLDGYYCQPDFGKRVAWQCLIPRTLLATWKCPKDTHLCRIVNDATST